jgi:ATPase family associated with various cellular activities (AAA)
MFSAPVETISYLSEIFRIVEGAIRLDGVKVRNYAELLADKLQDDGDKASALRLRKIVNRNSIQLHPKRVSQEPPPPVDGESRFPLLQEVSIGDGKDSYVVPEVQRDFIEDYLSVVRSKGALERKGIESGANLLLYGPPGCGKTFLASFIAKKIGLPLYVARLDGLISSFLGSTAKNIRAVFEYAVKTPCVLLLDEFDAIAKLRDDQQELGELKRVVNSFIQNMDALAKDTILIAATNHERLLDSAVWRRFEYVLHVDYPAPEHRVRLWEAFSKDIDWSPKQLRVLADLSDGYSVSAIESACVRLKQRKHTKGETPSLSRALTALTDFPADQSKSAPVITRALLNNRGKLRAVLQKRGKDIYSLSMIGEILGVSKSTMSRQESFRREARRKHG